MRQHPHLVHPRQQKHYVTQQQQQHHPQLSQQQQQNQQHQPHPQQQMQHLQQQQQQPHHHHPSSMASGHSTASGILADGQKKHKRPIGGGPYLTQQRSFSSSEEELRSTSEYEGKFFSPYVLYNLRLLKPFESTLNTHTLHAHILLFYFSSHSSVLLNPKHYLCDYQHLLSSTLSKVNRIFQIAFSINKVNS